MTTSGMAVFVKSHLVTPFARCYLKLLWQNRIMRTTLLAKIGIDCLRISVLHVPGKMEVLCALIPMKRFLLTSIQEIKIVNILCYALHRL